MYPEAESQLWIALFDGDQSCVTPETVTWLLSGPDGHFVQMLATHCEREQLIELIDVCRRTLRQVLNDRFSALRDGPADGVWRRSVQRAMDELIDLRPDLLEDLPAYSEDRSSLKLDGIVTSELSRMMSQVSNHSQVSA